MGPSAILGQRVRKFDGDAWQVCHGRIVTRRHNFRVCELRDFAFRHAKEDIAARKPFVFPKFLPFTRCRFSTRVISP